MTQTLPLSQPVLGQLFDEARTHVHWQARPVSEAQIREIYDLAKWGPTAMNCFPLRLKVVTGDTAKRRLMPALAEGNREKTMAAPATLIVGMDLDFHEQLPTLFPVAPAARALYADNEVLRRETAMRNSSLQAGYLIMAIRALGLDAGPMSGFDADRVDALFFPDSAVHTNLLINVGYGQREQLYPRGPRPVFDEVAEIL